MDKRTAVPYTDKEKAAVLELMAKPTKEQKQGWAKLIEQFPTRNEKGFKYLAGLLRKAAKKTTGGKPVRRTSETVTKGANSLQLRTIEMIVPHLNADQKLFLVGKLIE